MTKVKVPSKAASTTMDSHPGKPDTKAQKTPKSDRDTGDKAAALDKKKPTKNEKQLRDVDEEASYRAECCADCNKEVLDSHSAVNCDGCGLWHHTAWMKSMHFSVRTEILLCTGCARNAR